MATAPNETPGLIWFMNRGQHASNSDYNIARFQLLANTQVRGLTTNAVSAVPRRSLANRETLSIAGA